MDFITILFSLVAIAGVLYLSYVASKYLAKRMNRAANSTNIRIVEKATLGQDKGIAVVEVCSAYYLISFTSASIEILKELPEYAERSKMQGETKSFQEVFMENLASKFSGGGAKNDKK